MDRPEILTIKTTLSAAHLMLLAELPTIELPHNPGAQGQATASNATKHLKRPPRCEIACRADDDCPAEA